MEKQIEDKLRQMSQKEDDDLNEQMRLKLKRVADGWKERHRLNMAWANVRDELVLMHHKRNFAPVLENMLRYRSFKDNSQRWVMVKDELREVVDVADAVEVSDIKKDGGCFIM